MKYDFFLNMEGAHSFFFLEVCGYCRPLIKVKKTKPEMLSVEE